MKNYFLILAWVLTFIAIPITSHAWNATGHMIVAKIAYDRLEPQAKIKIDKMVADLSKEYPYISTFEQLSVWPDTLRSQKIDVYAHWHYTDIAFSDDGTPLKNLVDTDNVVWVINKIKPIVQNDKANSFERARFLSFLVHFVGDIHQPLHTTSRISAAHPDGDQGGNLYRIVYRVGDTQIKNLHQLWDGGVGIFEARANPAELANTITTRYPEAYFGEQIKDLNPDHWASEGFSLSTHLVYKTPENQNPLTSYIAESQLTAQQRVALAGYRLAALMNLLLTSA